MTGPLHGVKIIELAGIGPAPFAGMMLADMGAEVLRVDRAEAVRPAARPPVTDVLGRGRRSVGVDLKHPDGREAVLRLVEQADALIEGFRPGVTERLGIGPDECLARNPRLVYGRMTGWGQEGPYAAMAGHDINYIALSGTLAMIGRAGEKPVPPLNLIGDFGGGGMLLAYGVVCRPAGDRPLRTGPGHRRGHGRRGRSAGRMIHGLRALGVWGERGTNLLDTGAWYYDVYETADGEYVSFGSLEPQVLRGNEPDHRPGDDPDGRGQDRPGRLAAAMKERMGHLMKTRTRAEWYELLEGSDACFAPVLNPDEAARHPHNRQRATFTEVAGVTQPAPGAPFQPHHCRDRWSAGRPGAAHRRGAGRLGLRRRGSGRAARRRAPCADPGADYSRLTTGQVSVRVMPSIICRRLTIIRPSSSTESASARTITS